MELNRVILVLPHLYGEYYRSLTFYFSIYMYFSLTSVSTLTTLETIYITRCSLIVLQFSLLTPQDLTITHATHTVITIHPLV